METIYKGRKIVIQMRLSGTTWLLETTIWPASSEDAAVPRIIRTVRASGQSEDAHKMALEAVQKLIDDDFL